MATLALPQGASKLLSTTKGKVYALGGAGALAAVALLTLGGGEKAAPATKPAPAAVTVAPTTAAPAAPATTPYVPSPRNPFTKGDGSLPKAKG